MQFFSVLAHLFAILTILAQNGKFLQLWSFLNLKSILNLWKGFGTLIVHCFTEFHSFGPSKQKNSHNGPYWAEIYIFSPIGLKFMFLILKMNKIPEIALLKLFWHISTIRICKMSFWALNFVFFTFLAQDVCF